MVFLCVCLWFFLPHLHLLRSKLFKILWKQAGGVFEILSLGLTCFVETISGMYAQQFSTELNNVINTHLFVFLA